MSDSGAGPLCPKCRRPIAAWRLDHCIYCGERFPPGFRDGHEAPEALRWIERPDVPPEATRQLEMMKVVSFEKSPRARPIGLVMGLLSLPVFGVIFYLLYALVSRRSPTTAILIPIAGLGFLGYLGWSFYKTRR